MRLVVKSGPALDRGRPAQLAFTQLVISLIARRIAPDVLPTRTLIGEVEVLDPVLHSMVSVDPVDVRIAGG